MHEVGLLKAAVAEVVARTADEPPGHVVLAIGPGVDQGAAAAAWEDAAAGTPIALAEVAWQQAMDVLRCLECGTTYEGRKLDRCPSCAGDGLVVRPAPELAIEDWF